MKRIIIALKLVLILTLLLGTSVLAAAPDAILIDPDNPDKRVTIIKDNDKDGPPDILIKTPHGAKPKSGIPK